MRLSKCLFTLYVLACLASVTAAEHASTAGTPIPDWAKAVTFAYYPGLRKLEVRVSGESSETFSDGNATVLVCRQGDDRILAQKTFHVAAKESTCSIDLPVLEDGTYELRVALSGEPAQTTRKYFKHKNFVWLGNTLGKSETIYPPFEPIRVNDGDVTVVLRTYRMNGFGLWDSVRSEGKEVLAQPMVLHVQTEAGEQQWQFGDSRWTTVQPHLAVFEAVAAVPAVQVRTRSSIEYDGCMKVEMDLLPGTSGQTMQRFWLEIPLKDKETPLFHYAAFEGMRRNYAGKTPRGGKITWMSQPYDKDPPPWPEGALPPVWKAEPGSDDGLVWTCRDIRPWKHVIQSDFVPYIWLGGGQRGLAFFGANDKGYLLDSKGRVQTIERRGDTLYLRIDLVNKPSVINEPRHVIFGLQASPTRPMPENWRVRHKITPGNAGPVVCWGGYICADKYPEGYHFNVVDEICKVRQTGVVDRSIFEMMDKERAEPWKRPWGGTGAPGFDTWLDRDFWWFVNRAKELHDNSDWRKIAADGVYSEATAKVLADPPWIAYTEEHASDVTEPEWEAFQDEWRAEWPWTKPRNETAGRQQPVNNSGYGHQAFPDSYLDFCLYCHNEWFKRGIGVYFDNTMPYAMYNPLLSDAYYSEDAHIQPACSIWEQRKYYKRVWQLMNELQRKGVPRPLTFAQHITNTLLLPWSTWNTIDLDMEWSWFPDTSDASEGRKRLNVPFPPDLLLAETVGRQTGSMGDSHFGILGTPNQTASFPPTYARSEWGMRVVHEIGVRENNALEKALWKFGYGTDRTTVTNYWSDDPPATVTDPDHNKWLLVVRKNDNALLLVLQTWNKADTSVTVTLDPARLGFRPSSEIWDVETGEQVPIAGTTIQLTLPGPYGTRVVTVGARQ